MGSTARTAPAVDPNALDPAGTTALDWYYPERRRPAARLRAVRERQRAERAARARRGRAAPACPTGFPAPAPRTSPGCRTHSGFYYTRYPAPGDRARRARSTTTARSTSTRSAATRPTDPLVYRPAREGVLAGREPLARRALAARSAWPAPSTRPICTSATGMPAGGRRRRRWCRWPRTCRRRSRARWRTAGSSCAPTSTPRPTGCTRWIPSVPQRGHWRELVPPRPDAVLEGVRVLGRPARAQLSRAGLVPPPAGGSRRRPPPRGRAADAGQPVRPRRPSGTATSCSSASRRTRSRRASTGIDLGDRRADALAPGRGRRRPRAVRGAAGERRRRATARRSPCSWCTSAGSRARATRRPISPATAASTSA